MRKLLLLKLANANFGIWENELEDVRPDLVVHSLPYNNRCIAGVARLNDRFLSIADLSYCMGYPQVQGETRTVLVMPGDKDVAGFVIDGNLDSIETDEKTLIPIEKCAQSVIIDSCIYLQSKLIPIINIVALHNAVQSADFVLSGQNMELKKSTQKKGDKKLHFVECDNHPFALQASAIENAITRPQEIAPISQLPGFAEGLMYYSQKAVPLISLTRRIGFSTEDQSSFVLPVHIEDQIICFLISSDRGELEPDKSTDPLPPLVKSKWLESVIIHENVILPVIDSYSMLLPGADEKTEQESDQYDPTVSFEPGSNDTDVIELSLIGVKHAIPKAEVKDSLDIQSLTRIPNVSPMILGVVEYMGEIIPVLDLALCYGEVSSITPNWKMALVENSNFKAFVATDRVFDPHLLKSDLQRRLPINLANQFVYGCYTDHNSDAVILILNVPSIAIHYKSEASDSTLTIFAKEFEDSVKDRKDSPLESRFELPPQPEKVAVERVVPVQKQEYTEVVETESEEDPVTEAIEQEEDQEQVGAEITDASEQEFTEQQPEDQELSAEEEAYSVFEPEEELAEEQTEEDEPAVTEEKTEKISEDERIDSEEEVAVTAVAEENKPTDQTADSASEKDAAPEEVTATMDETTETEDQDTLLEDADDSVDESTETEEADTVLEQAEVAEDEVTEVEESDNTLEDSTETDTRAPEVEEPEDEDNDESTEETIAEDGENEDETLLTEDSQSEDEVEEADTESEIKVDVGETDADSEIPGEIVDGEAETVVASADEYTSEGELASNEAEDSAETAETDSDEDITEESKQNEEPETVAAFTADNVMSSPEGLDDIEYDMTIPEESTVSEELSEQEEFIEETESAESTPQEAIEAEIDDQSEDDLSKEVEDTIVEDIEDSANEEDEEEIDEIVSAETMVSAESDVENETEVEATKSEDLQEEADAKESDAELGEQSKTKPKKPDYLHVAKAIELDTPKPESKSSKGRFFFIAAALFGLVIAFFVGPFQQQEPAIQPLSEQTEETTKQEPRPEKPAEIPEETIQPQELPTPEEVDVVVDVKPEPVIIEETEVLPPQRPEEPETETINYVVKKGDYLFRITKTYTGDGYNYPKIQEENKIANADLIYPDQVIKIKIEKQDESE